VKSKKEIKRREAGLPSSRVGQFLQSARTRVLSASMQHGLFSDLPLVEKIAASSLGDS